MRRGGSGLILHFLLTPLCASLSKLVPILALYFADVIDLLADGTREGPCCRFFINND